MTKPTRPGDDEKATRDELIRAMLDPGHLEADELGRTKPGSAATEPPPEASPRAQAAMPIKLTNVDE